MRPNALDGPGSTARAAPDKGSPAREYSALAARDQVERGRVDLLDALRVRELAATRDGDRAQVCRHLSLDRLAV